MPVAWDRLADATQPQAGALSVVTLGHVHTEDLTPLTTRFQRVEQLVLDIAPRDPLSRHRAEFNRALDAATADWVLVVRERETVSDALAGEVAAAVVAAKARGFRIPTVVIYAGRPLRTGGDAGEVRLFHRRYYLRFANKGEWQEITVQGPVLRLTEAFRSATFESTDEHRRHLAGRAAPHSRLRHLLLFARYALAAQTIDGNTLRYLWIEAGFDVPAGE